MRQPKCNWKLLYQYFRDNVRFTYITYHDYHRVGYHLPCPRNNVQTPQCITQSIVTSSFDYNRAIEIDLTCKNRLFFFIHRLIMSCKKWNSVGTVVMTMLCIETKTPNIMLLCILDKWLKKQTRTSSNNFRTPTYSCFLGFLFIFIYALHTWYR